MNKSPTVAIITSTIGRPKLADAIESVKNQSYPCKHYIFVDGEQFADKARAIVDKYDDLVVTYLPMNTGANGWVNSSINAIAPYLVKEDIICHLDDDNWYEPNHVQSIVETFERCPDADFVYTLRNFYDLQDRFICHDDIESLGIFDNKVLDIYPLVLQIENQTYHLNTKFSQAYHIDTNCYAFRHPIAVMLANSWFSGIFNDRNVLKTISELNLSCASTQQYSVNYVVDVYKIFDVLPILRQYGVEVEKQMGNIQKQLADHLIGLCQENIRRHGGRPWAAA